MRATFSRAACGLAFAALVLPSALVAQRGGPSNRPAATPTAAVPGKRAPILVTKEMVEAMAPGSVVVDIAAVRGGNCELTKPGETVVHNGVSILGPVNFASLAPYHASQMYSSNVVTFLKHLQGFLPVKADCEDEIVRETLVTHGGEVSNARVRELTGLAPLVHA